VNTKVKQIMDRLSGTAHRGGAFNSEVLVAIAENLPSGDVTTLETGCGKSTIMFSHLSARHYVFAYDDRGAEGSSVDLVQHDPEFKSETITWVFGPTQRTLLHYPFGDVRFDVILLDGPHGYPFPDFEYAILYERLKPGGVLILDDVHIPSIGNMYDLLREDRMYEEIGVIATTGLLRRTDVVGVPSDGDHWFEQSYNFMRFPLAMEKYKPDRSVAVGSKLDLANAALRAKHVVKSLEPAPAPMPAGVVRTTDIGASFEAHVPANAPEKMVLRLTHRSIYRDAADGATVSINGHSWPLPYAADWQKAEFPFDRPPHNRVVVTVTHPAAIPEHDRQIKRYEFRRLGSYLKDISIAAVGGKREPASRPGPSEREPKPNRNQVLATLTEYAKHFRYDVAPGLREAPYLETSGGEPLSAMHGRLPQKSNWSISELLAFEGADFPDAVSWALAGRPATAEERSTVGRDNGAATRVGFVVALDHANRKARNGIRVLDLGSAARVWRTARFFRRSGWTGPARIFEAMFRNRARTLVERNLAATAQIQHIQLLIQAALLDAKKGA